MGGRAGRRPEGEGGPPQECSSRQTAPVTPHPSPRQRPSTVVASCSQGCSRDVAPAWDRGATVLGWRGACLHPKRKLATRFPLPAPKMATTASRPHETHALYSAATNPAPLGLTGLLQVTVGTLKVGTSILGPSPPAAEGGPGSARPAQWTPRPACNTSCGRRVSEGARMPGASGPFAPLIGGPTPWGRAYTSIGP